MDVSATLIQEQVLYKIGRPTRFKLHHKMSHKLFGDDWLQKMEEQYEEAVSLFKAAVAKARAGSDEAIRQVSYFLV